MPKPQTISGYEDMVTDACERVLVTLLRGLGPWKDSVFLVGGLAPRYLVTARPPKVPKHAGTGDVDIVVDVGILTTTEAYSTLEENLKAMNFERAENDKGAKQSWRWRAEIEDGTTMILEFLADSPELGGGKVKELPSDGNVSALNIPHASMVFDHHGTVEITADLLNGKGRATEVVRYADIVTFTCLKAFAFDQRFERKDAHDLIYCIENLEGGVGAAQSAFAAAL
ncbi:MAG: antitoxin, partial [Afipia sp.]|nr:antitoxin [Afipia sp.]